MPIVIAGMLLLGWWSYLQSRAVVEDFEHRNLAFILGEAMKNHISRRADLLERTGLQGVQSFVERYQADAWADVVSYGRANERDFLIYDGGNDTWRCSCTDPA